MKYKTHILSVLTVITNITFLQAQSDKKLNIQVGGKFLTSKITTLNEIHGVTYLSVLKTLMVEKLITSGNLTDIVLEVGNSAAYLYNKYIITGDTNYISDHLGYSSGKYRDFWNLLHKYYISGKLITIHGVDFERAEFVKAIKIALLQNKKTQNELYNYLSSLPDTIMNLNDNISLSKKSRIEILRRCVILYHNRMNYYDSNDNNTINKILNNPVSEQKWGKRFRNMENQLTKLYNNRHNYLLILGAYHVENSRPIFKSAQDKYNISKDSICIISIVAKNCTTTGYGAQNTLFLINGNKHIIKNNLFMKEQVYVYYNECNYSMIMINREIEKRYSINNKNNIDYIIPIDCEYTTANCIY